MDIYLLYFMFGLGYGFSYTKYGQNITTKIIIVIACILFFPVFLANDICNKLNN